MVTVSQIINITAPDVLRISRKQYKLGDPFKISTDKDSAYVAYLKDPISRLAVPLVWSHKDENTESELDIIDLVTSLLTNGIRSLDMLIEEQTETEVEDVQT